MICSGNAKHGELIVEGNEDMLIFDALPPNVRRAIRDAKFEMAACDVQPYVTRYGQYEATKQIGKRQRSFQRKTRVEFWGEEYPK